MSNSFVIPWTVALQASWSMGYYRSGIIKCIISNNSEEHSGRYYDNKCFTDEKTKTQREEVSLPKNIEPGSGRASMHLWNTTPHCPLRPGLHARSSLPSPDADNPCLCFANAHAPCWVSSLLTSKKFPLMPSPTPSHHSPKSLDRARCPSSIPSQHHHHHTTVLIHCAERSH